MKRIITHIIPTIAAITSVAIAQQTYYKNPDALFSRRPDPAAPISHVQRFGPVGVSIDLMSPVFVMHIQGVEAGSPAMKAGLKQGMIIQKASPTHQKVRRQSLLLHAAHEGAACE